MSLLSRLAEILRAKLLETNDIGTGTANFSEEEQVEYERRNTGESGAPGVDPVMAGYYANLELAYGADLPAVRDAWKRLQRKYHPDLHSSDPAKREIATELVKGLNHAYEQICRRLEPKR